MNVWKVTDADRDSDGRIWVTPPARTLADLLPAEPKEENTQRPPWRPSRLELAGLVGGLVLAVAAIAALNTFWPAPAPVARPTAKPAPTTAPTAPPTRTQAPTATPEPPTAVPTQPPPPTPEPVIVIQPPPCDLQNPPYQVRMDVAPYGHVVGFSCSSVEEAQANADRLAAELRATAEAR